VASTSRTLMHGDTILFGAEEMAAYVGPCRHVAEGTPGRTANGAGAIVSLTMHECWHAASLSIEVVWRLG